MVNVKRETCKTNGKKGYVNGKCAGNVWAGVGGTYWCMHPGTGNAVNGPYPSMELAKSAMLKGFEDWINKQDAKTKAGFGIKEAPVARP